MTKSQGKKFTVVILALCLSISLAFAGQRNIVESYADFGNASDYEEYFLGLGYDFDGGAEEHPVFDSEGGSVLLEAYKAIDEFYTKYVVNDVEEFHTFTQKELRTAADKRLKDLHFTASAWYDGGDFSSAKVSAYLNADFESEVLTQIRADESELAEYALSKRIDIEDCYDKYFGVKYGKEYTLSVLYEGDEQAAINERNELIDSLIDLDGANVKDVKSKIDKKVNDYKDKFFGLKTFLKRKADEINAEYIVKSKEQLDDEGKSYLDGIDECESAFVDAQTLGANNLADEKANLSSILSSYKKLLLSELEENKKNFNAKYGSNEAQEIISKNKDLAKNLINALGENGKLPEDLRYSVGDLTVEDGTDILQAFNEIEETAGVLKYDGEESKALTDFALVSSVKFEGEDFDVLLEAFESDGETPKEIFDRSSELKVREGASLAVKRNINTILRKSNLDEFVGDGVDSSLIEGKTLKNFLTITVYEPNKSGDKNLKAVDLDFDGDTRYFITVSFHDEQSDITVISYYHTTITEILYQTMSEENSMRFEVKDASSLQLGILDDSTWTDLGKWIVLGVLGLVVLLWLVYILVKCLKNRKYRIYFRARGGKYNKIVKFRKGQAFNYPNDPVKKGFVFMGWYTDKKCTTKFASGALLANKNTSVYAKWVKVEDYERLCEEQARINAADAGSTVDAQYFAELQKSPQVVKLEAEKLAYEAKKAEEERKTEEIKLQTIREIEQSKANAAAREQAEEEDRKLAEKLEETIASPDELAIDDKEEQQAQDDFEKAKEEAYKQGKLDALLEAKAREDEEARINALVEERLRRLNLAPTSKEEKPAEKDDFLEKLLLLTAAMGYRGVPVAQPVAQPVAPAPAPAPEVEKFTSVDAFNGLKSFAFSFDKADDLEFSLDNDPVVAIKEADGKVELQLNAAVDELGRFGFFAEEGDFLPAKILVSDEDDLACAKKAIAFVMSNHGYVQGDEAEETSTAKERKNGLVLGNPDGRLPENVDEYFKLLRVHACSFVYGKGKVQKDLPLVKMFKGENKVYLYVNHTAEGLKDADELFKAEGFTSFTTVSNVDELVEAVKVIDDMMKKNGLKKVPFQVSIGDSADDDGFTYVLKA